MKKEDQDALARKLYLIIQDKFGSHFFSENQGAGAVVNYKINTTQGKKKIMEKAKKFVVDELGINLENIEGHGANCNDYTFIVKMSELSDFSIKKIRSLSQVIIRREKKSGSKVLPLEKTEETPSVDNSQSVTTVVKDVAMCNDNVSRYRSSLSRFLRPVMESESVFPNSFPFIREENSGSTIIVRCDDEVIGEMIERSIAYTSLDICVRYGNLVMVDCLKFTKNHKQFAFPLQRGQGAQVLLEKIKRVYPCSPSIEERENGFLISFKKKTVIPKVVAVLKSMGWNILSSDEKTALIGYDSGKEEDEQSNVPNVLSSSEIDELRFIYENSASVLSPETMERIERVLKDDLKNNHPEEYAKILLNKLGY